MGLKENAALLLSSPNPKVMINFPLRSEYSAATSSTGSRKKKSTKDDDGWITKKNKKPRSTSKTKKKKATPNKTKAKKGKNTRGRGQTKKSGQPEVIDISDDSSSSDDEPLVRKRSSRLSATMASKKLRSCDDSLFDTDQSSENEF